MSKENLTGGQIQEIMDTLLYNALESIILHTNIFDSQLIYLLTAVIKNKKRKYCALPREATIDILCQAIATDDRRSKFDLIKKLKIERSFIHVFVKRFLNEYRQPYLEIYSRFMSDPKKRAFYLERLAPYKIALGADSIQDVFVCVTQPQEFLNLFYKYFESILEQYRKFCYTHAKHLIDTNTGNNYDFKDVVQNFLKSVVVALNKYDSSKGALTSYIKYWILNSLTCASSEHEYGIAYTIPQNHKKTLGGGNNANVNFSTSMDALLSAGEDEDGNLHELLTAETEDLSEEHARDSELDRIYLMAKKADPFGLARLALEIPEVFTKEEIDLMDRLTLKKIGKSSPSKTVNTKMSITQRNI